MGRGLIPGTIWKISCHNLFITYFTLTFSKHRLLYCKKDLWTDKLRELPLFNLQIFLFRFWFQKYTKQCRSVQGRSKLFAKSTLTFEWKFLFDTMYTFELIIPFQVKLDSNMLKCVNFIEIRSYAYLYASSFLVLWQQSI
jgi:hypothetical protein